jgi:hypothetical protein
LLGRRYGVAQQLNLYVPGEGPPVEAPRRMGPATAPRSRRHPAKHSRRRFPRPPLRPTSPPLPLSSTGKCGSASARAAPRSRQREMDRLDGCALTGPAAQLLASADYLSASHALACCRRVQGDGARSAGAAAHSVLARRSVRRDPRLPKSPDGLPRWSPASRLRCRTTFPITPISPFSPRLVKLPP